MRQTLLYGESAGQGWENATAFTSSNIDDTITTDTATSKNNSKMPRVSVPSPFARFDLVQKAFGNLAAAKNLSDTDDRDRKLVSDSLDAIELFYENNDATSIVRWSKKIGLDELSESISPQQQLFGNALRLFLRQESYGFDEALYFSDNGVRLNDINLYFITYNNDPVAITSPVSIFMASPRPEIFNTPRLSIDGGKRIFTQERPLYRRNEEFVAYLYRYIEFIRRNCTTPETLAPLAEFRNYLDSQKKIIREINPSLYSVINNLTADTDIMQAYSRAEDVSVLGFPMFRRLKADAVRQIQTESDFVINSGKSESKPLVLTNNFTEVNRAFTSKSQPWNRDIHKIDYTHRHNKEAHYEFLKNYPDGWLYEHDFLADALVELPYRLDDKFFDGNLTGIDNVAYLLPLKSKFFEFFDYDYLMGHDGRDPIFAMHADSKDGKTVDKVTVTLKIAAGHSNNFITLKKTYLRSENAEEGMRMKMLDTEEARGVIVEYPVALNIYPFVKLEGNNSYLFQLLQYVFIGNKFELSLAPCVSGKGSGADVVKSVPELQSVSRTESSSYWRLNGDFDYIRINVKERESKQFAVSHEAVLIPKAIPTYRQGAEKFRFAFDFGTSNSHVAVRNAAGEYLDFSVRNLMVSTISPSTVITQDNNMSMAVFYSLARQEWLPVSKGIGGDYSFPMATVLSVPKAKEAHSDRMRALLHSNIPFVYGKEDYGEDANTIRSNIKWDREDKKYAEAYIEELVLLARGFAIEHRADLKNCEFVWTYPVSMRDDDVDEFNSIWEKYYRMYFNPQAPEDTEMVKRVTESIAPLLYYRDNDKAISEMSLSIDIGGGTCDVVLFKNDKEQHITSFRFGADNIFGVGTSDRIGMVKEGLQHFIEKWRSASTDMSRRKVIDPLERLLRSGAPAAESNRFLFALESHPALHDLEIGDKSYNSWLADKEQYRIIFIYYYAAIIYYLVKLMMSRGYDNKPEAIFLSGTGSKLLNIIGGRKFINKLTTLLIEGFSDGEFSYNTGGYISVNIESQEPKQLTAKGALFVKDIAAEIAAKINEDTLPAFILRNSMSKTVESRSDRQLLNSDLKNPAIKKEITDEVRKFNSLFTSILDKNAEALHISKKELEKFNSYDTKLDSFMETVISNDYNSITKEGTGLDDMAFKDSPFFFPIKWIIRSELEQR